MIRGHHRKHLTIARWWAKPCSMLQRRQYWNAQEPWYRHHQRWSRRDSLLKIQAFVEVNQTYQQIRSWKNISLHFISNTTNRKSCEKCDINRQKKRGKRCSKMSQLKLRIDWKRYCKENTRQHMEKMEACATPITISAMQRNRWLKSLASIIN